MSLSCLCSKINYHVQLVVGVKMTKSMSESFRETILKKNTEN